MKLEMIVLSYHLKCKNLTNNHGLIECFDETENVINMKIISK
jgi:hypothetical protein